METKQRVKTIADIARLAGVSPSTASRALSDSDLISLETKERIKSIAEAHSFRPHLGARNLRTKKSSTVAIVFPFDFADTTVLANPYIFKVFGTIGSALRAKGYDSLLSKETDISALIDDRYIHSGLSEGAIVLGRGDNDPKKMASLAETGIPLVVVGPQHENQKYCSVGIDNRQSASMVVNHLYKLGRRKIAFVGDNYRDPLSEGYQRYEGFCIGLDQVGLDFDPDLAILSTYAGRSGYDAVELLLEAGKQFDALFVATSDVVAIGAIQALQEAGINIPEDVSVVGFDNIDLCDFINPPLTSVSQRLNDGLAEIIVSKLFMQINGEKVSSTMLPGRLVVRQSCGAA